MVISVTVTTLGLQEARNYFLQVPRRMPQVLDRALKKSSRLLAAEMGRHVPQATGKLRKSIGVKRNRPRSYSIGPSVRWAKFVIEGRSAGAAPPNLRGRRFKKWLRFRGIPREDWFVVAKSIGKKGIPASDFMGIAFANVQRAMFNIVVKDLQILLQRSVKAGGKVL